MRSLFRLAGWLVVSSVLAAGPGELSNRPAPPFRLSDPGGRTVSLADFHGKFLVIEFIATTCPHCQKFAPVLEGIRAQFKECVGVVGIATYADNASTVANFVQTYKIGYPILLDTTNSAAMAYLKPPPPNYNFSIPYVFLIDQAGYIRDDFTQTPYNLDLFTPAGFTRLVEGYLGRR